MSQELHCHCGRGVFLGWNSWIVYAALAAGVLYSWLTGKVIEHFSTVMRSVFDGFPIVLLWFIITPAASRIPLQAFREHYVDGPKPFIDRDWGKDLMTIVNPLSAITYIEAAAQVREVTELRRKHVDETCLALGRSQPAQARCEPASGTTLRVSFVALRTTPNHPYTCHLRMRAALRARVIQCRVSVRVDLCENA